MDAKIFEEFKNTVADEVHRDYGLPIGSEFDKKNFNKIIEMATCSNLFVENLSEEDFIDILKYSIVVMDAEKYHLDWKRAFTELKIEEKIKKYLPQS